MSALALEMWITEAGRVQTKAFLKKNEYGRFVETV